MTQDHYNIAIIGAGPGGYVAALVAAQLGAKVALIEKQHLGGTCLNNGCIPSKALLASAELLAQIKDANSLGVNISGTVEFDWPAIQKRKDKTLQKLRMGIAGLLKTRLVTVINGTAKLDGKNIIAITNDNKTQTITADNIIIATGSTPSLIPNLPDAANIICTTDQALHWDTLPNKLLIVGAGVIGCEFACMMAEFGVDVTMVEMQDTLLPEMDHELGKSLAKVFIQRGIRLCTSTKITDLTINDHLAEAALTDGTTIRADRVLIATGRTPNTDTLSLDTAGIATDRGFVTVNDKMQTSAPGYYCIGDANGRCLLAHAASAQAEVAVKNALGQNAEYNLPVPNAVYTFPEIASVGLTTQQAQAQNLPITIGRFPIGCLGKAMAAAHDFGFAKVIRHADNDALIGVHIISHNATEIIASAAAMLTQKATTSDLAEMIFAHPTLSEAVKEAAADSFCAAIHLPPKKIASTQ